MWETKKLEYFINLRLYFEKNNVSSLWFYHLKEYCKWTNTCWRYIIECCTVEDKIYKACFNNLSDFLLKISWIICVDISCEINDESVRYSKRLIQTYLEAVIFILIKARNSYVVVFHFKLFPHNFYFKLFNLYFTI